MTDAPRVPVPDGKKADLVLEGGGVKGIGLVGAVLTLHDAGYQFPRVAGTSAGAITAALVAALQAAGKPLTSARGVRQLGRLPEVPSRGLAPTRARPGRRRRRAAAAHGPPLGRLPRRMARRDPRRDRDHDLRAAEDGRPRQLAARSDLRYSLIVHTADITRRKVVRLPWDYGNYGLDPGRQRIVDAVRASMSIPFFFEPVRGQGTRRDLRRCDLLQGIGDVGRRRTAVELSRRSVRPQRRPTPTMADDRHQAVSARHDSAVRAASDDTIHEAIDCLQTLLNNADRYYLTPDKVARTIFIDSTGITATDFDITPEQRATLFGNGQNAASQWLSQNASPNATATT